MKDEIMNYVREKGGYVSFANLSNHIAGFSGNGQIIQESTNFVFCNDISDAGYQALADLFAEDKIIINPCHYFVYFIDGIVPQLPRVKQARRYKTPHWLPVTINLPHQEGFKIIL